MYILAQRTAAYSSIEIHIFTFLLIVLGWFIPGISGGPTWTPPPSITCGTVQLFFEFLLHLVKKKITKKISIF